MLPSGNRRASWWNELMGRFPQSLQLLVDTPRVCFSNGQSDEIELAKDLLPWITLRILNDAEERATARGTRHERRGALG